MRRLETMKKLVLVSVLTVCMAGAAQADLYTDPIDWSLEPILLSHPLSASKTYTHDITDDGFPHLGETVTDGTLEVWLHDALIGAMKERFTLTYDGTTWTSEHKDIPDDPTLYLMTISPSVLSDGVLDVTVTANDGAFYLDKSLLTVTTLVDDSGPPVVPVPGAVLLGLLGMGAAGLKLRGFARV